MTNTIHRHQLRYTDSPQGFNFDNNAKILHCAEAKHTQRIDIWVELDKTEKPSKEMSTYFVVLATGKDVPDGYEHLQTVITSMGVARHIYKTTVADGRIGMW